MGRIGEGGGGWDGPPTGHYFFCAGSPVFFLGHFHKILNISSESLAQAPSIAILFEQIGYKGGSEDTSKSQRHTCSGAGCGKSQGNEAAFHSKLPGFCQHEILSGLLKK